jgi:NADP-dependent 3-hydroxy acid dehydrogenase YdfG
LATRLVGEGAEVWIADRQADQAEELAQRLNSGGGKAHAVELDVRSYPAFERAIAEAIQRSGRIDFLFDNAASPCDPGRATSDSARPLVWLAPAESPVVTVHPVSPARV